MRTEAIYHLCVNHLEDVVDIQTHDQAIYRGIIKEVDRDHVYLLPVEQERFFPFVGGALVGFGLASIAGLGFVAASNCYGPCGGYGYGPGVW